MSSTDKSETSKQNFYFGNQAGGALKRYSFLQQNQSHSVPTL